MEEHLELHIDRLAYGGAGIARDAEGRAVFVRGACPGDVVRARVTARHPRYVEAESVEVLEASPARVEPPCPYFGTCGGCQWQHIDRETQLIAKREAVSDALSRIGGIPSPAVSETLSGEADYGYRNKIELGIELDPQGRTTVGMHVEHSTELVPIDACLLLPRRAAKSPKALAGALRYLARGTDLALTRAVIRVAAHTSDLEVDLWGAPGGFPRATVAKTLGQALHPSTVTRVLADPAKARGKAKVEVLSGRGHWRERLSGHTFRVSAPSFFQVNTRVAEMLSGLVVSEVGADGTDTVLDLYCGVGTFTLPLAEVAGDVIAVETSGPALRDLRENLDEADLDADIAPGDAARALEDIGHFDLAVVDPPRAGLLPEVVAALTRVMPERIVYVSCDPATLARDAKSLIAGGYSFVRATPVDLFPQTYHVETVAVFEASRGDSASR